MRTGIFWTVAAAIGTLLTPAFGGTVITSGLPGNTAIINIDATQDGSAAYSGGQALWYQPFSAGGAANLLEYTFQPGTYSFRIVNPTDAAQMFPSLNSTQLAQIYTAWSYNSPYVTDYLAFNSSALSNSSEYQLFAGAVVPSNSTAAYFGATDAYNAAISGGYYNQIVSGPNGRYTGTVSNAYTFDSPTTLVFAIPDYALTDNHAGVSVLVTAVPEPASVSMLGVGVVLLLRRRRVAA